MSKTKEEILGEGGAACEYNWELPVVPYDDAIKAMTDYSSQQNAELLQALEECEEYFNNRADIIDQDEFHIRPNEEMTLSVKIRNAINKAKQ